MAHIVHPRGMRVQVVLTAQHSTRAVGWSNCRPRVEPQVPYNMGAAQRCGHCGATANSLSQLSRPTSSSGVPPPRL